MQISRRSPRENLSLMEKIILIANLQSTLLLMEGKSAIQICERCYHQKENNKTNVKTYLLLLVCDFLLVSPEHIDQLCGV